MTVEADKLGYKRRWIPVSERLPEENGQYLVTTTDVIGEPMIRMRSFAKNLKKVDPYDFVDAKGCGWYYYDSEYGHWQDMHVKAWMPLPEPYKSESEDKCRNCEYSRNPDYTRCHECEAESEKK